MRVVAKREKEYRFWGILLVGSIIELLSCILQYVNVIIIIFSLIMITVSGILFIYYLVIPKEIISLDEYNRSIYLHPDDVWLNSSSLKSVEYKLRSMRYGKSKNGKIIIKTYYKEYRYNHVSNVQQVAAELKRLIILEEIKSEE